MASGDARRTPYQHRDHQYEREHSGRPRHVDESEIVDLADHDFGNESASEAAEPADNDYDEAFNQDVTAHRRRQREKRRRYRAGKTGECLAHGKEDTTQP